MAINIALYQPSGNIWAMTERSSSSLARRCDRLTVGRSSLSWSGGEMEIDFDEVALPWPGQRFLPRRFAGQIRLTPSFRHHKSYELDPDGEHVWWPYVPKARAAIECDLLPDGGWQGEAYHDLNFGTRPLEADFSGWDWARGPAPDGGTLVLYDAAMKSGARSAMALKFAGDGDATSLDAPPRQPLPRGGWGVSGGVSCDADTLPQRIRKLEDTPFYTRSLIRTSLHGQPVEMFHETLDCGRLANPIVRLMLPFRMPRRGGFQAHTRF